MRTRYVLLAIGLVLSNLAWVQAEEKLGTLTGRFVYDGEAPEPVVNVMPDGRAVLDESLIVDGASRGIQNVIVSMYFKPGGVRPTEASDAVPPAKLPAVTIRGDNSRLEPHVSIVRVGQTLEFSNIGKNSLHLAADFIHDPPLRLIVTPGKKVDTMLMRAERLPVLFFDTVKPRMNGYLVVADHPWVAVSDLTGSFEIRDIPPGEWTFRVWQEKTGFVEKVTRDGEPTKFTKGQVKLTIAAGSNSLGDILVSPDEFKGR